MCTGAELAMASLAMSAGGAYMQQQSTDDAAQKQQNILRAGEEENAKISQKGEERVNDFAKDVFDPAARDARYEGQIVKREQSLSDALASANAKPNEQQSGKVSLDFVKGSASAQAAAGAEAAKQAKLMARVGGSGLMYGQEALMGGNLESDLSGYGQQVRRNARYTEGAARGVRDTGSLAGGLLQGGAAAVGAYRPDGYSVGQGSAYGGNRRGL